MTDGEHHVTRIVAPQGFVPKLKLLRQIRRRLSGKRGVGWTNALALVAVTRSARQKAARTIAFMIKLRSGRLRFALRQERQFGIIRRHRAAIPGIKLFRYPVHLRMIATAIGIGLKLSRKIADIQTRQSRHACPVAVPVKAVAGETRVVGTGLCTPHRDDVSVFCEAVQRLGFSRRAAGKHHYGGEWNHDAHVGTTGRSARLFRFMALAPMIMPIAACKPPPDDRQLMPMASAANGKQVIERVGCGSCHVIPGVDWPKGKVGPELAGLAGRALIAGKLPNRPDMLAAYIRNAPAIVRGSAMPAMPLTEAEARDIAAYLYQQGNR